MRRAIAESIKQQEQQFLTYDKYYLEDFKTPEDGIRKREVPVGLRNVGNSKF